MLPKVATHLLHQTTRAAAAVQSQAFALRNVLQSQSTSSGPTNASSGLVNWTTTGSSSWGSYGAGPGGAKYHAGSRFYSGYTGAGRAVTQANASTVQQDGSLSQSDDNEDLIPIRSTSRSVSRLRSRTRSHSLSINIAGRHERGEKLGVLKAVQLHTRASNAFNIISRTESVAAIESANPPEPTGRPALVRRNSTSSSLASEHDTVLLSSQPPSPRSSSPRPSSAALPTDPSTPQTTRPPRMPNAEMEIEEESSDLWTTSLLAAAKSGDTPEVTRRIDEWRSQSSLPTVRELNTALKALIQVRQAGEPLNPILELYNDMIKRSVMPNLTTYFILINALTARDEEVRRVITALEWRLKRRPLIGRNEASNDTVDSQRIAALKAEGNFGSAMSLFEAVIAFGSVNIGRSIYTILLRSCAAHANVDAAIHVFAHLEQRPDMLPSAANYGYLIDVFANVGDLAHAKEVFDEFRAASAADRIAWSSPDGQEDSTAADPYRAQVAVWNRMIEAYFRGNNPAGALGLLEQMLDSPSESVFNPHDVPPPTSATYTQIVSGFCHMGDIKTAMTWFNKLLEQESIARSSYEYCKDPPRPEQTLWMVMLETLAMEDMVHDINRIFATFLDTAERDGLDLRKIDRFLVVEANLRYLEKNPNLSDAEAISMLDFLVNRVLNDPSVPFLILDRHAGTIIQTIAEQYVKRMAHLKAADVVASLVERTMRTLKEDELKGNVASYVFVTQFKTLVHLMHVFMGLMVANRGDKQLSYAAFQRLFRLRDAMGMKPIKSLGPFLLHRYALAKKSGHLPPMFPPDWEALLYSAVKAEFAEEQQDLPIPPGEYAFTGLPSLLEDIARAGLPLKQFSVRLVQLAIQTIYKDYGVETLQDVFIRLGPENEALLNNPSRDLNVLQKSLDDAEKSVICLPGLSGNVRVDSYHSRFVGEFYNKNPSITPMMAYERFEAGVKQNVYPLPQIISHLINAMGRLGEMQKVRTLYDSAQAVLASIGHDLEWQKDSWYRIEDAMVIACAHAGEMDAAFVHRNRILEHGGVPSPDAYGALIAGVKDTTDDTSNALTLFQEALAEGVVPHIYMYNTVISKLSKARKSEYALELFQQMKSQGLQPSSITYGAVIAACARVGDAHSAELLFAEMTARPNFKPRIPPYNTMMQLYTQTKPNRAKVIQYYEAMLSADISPSAHTYKLLMDAYGTIEPVDMDAMQAVLDTIIARKDMHVNGGHWASIINAWGCVKKDLQKALDVFDSVSSYRAASSSSARLPDAVVFQAIFHVIITHRRTDLLDKYWELFRHSNIHMTAYIANQLIKGYAIGGQLDKSRMLFASLVDPPEGLAAQHNHAPHEDEPSVSVSSSAPVYREPSTWEAMVRGELANGNRGEAVSLLERLRARKFPPAVYNRISGIMLEDSVSPWPATYLSHDPHTPL